MLTVRTSYQQRCYMRRVRVTTAFNVHGGVVAWSGYGENNELSADVGPVTGKACMNG